MSAVQKVVIAVALVAAAAGAALAEEGFEAYTPEPIAKQVYAPTFVIIAYAVIWVAVVAYTVALWRRLRRLDEEIARLRQEVGEGRGEAP